MYDLRDTPKLAYSLEEFCEEMGLTRSRALREIRERRLRVAKLGSLVLIPVKEVAAWLERLLP